MEYLERMKAIQMDILEYLDTDQENILSLLSNQKNQYDKNDLKSILYLISKISKNHYHGPYFFEKIKTIINKLKDEIKHTFTNKDIYNIFKKNKRMLLLLIKEDLLTVDYFISVKLSVYQDYFYPEIQKELPNKYPQKEFTENYEEKRLNGENDSFICDIIRNDRIEEFVVYFTKNGISPDMQINPSIFETNPFLLKHNPTLIEYSLFFGSIQIFDFLFQQNAQLEPISWLYTIHGRNPDLIHKLEYAKILPDNENYEECLKESIKCHNNDFVDYFENIVNIQNNSNFFKNKIYYGFRFYNYNFIPDKLDKPIYLLYAIENDYFNIVKYIVNMKEFDINNEITIYNLNCCNAI